MAAALMQQRQATQWPTSYIALGDSYAAGIGAGKYVEPRDDPETRLCKRFDGSYPSQLKAMLGQVPDDKFDFVACSGHELKNLTSQFDKLGDKRAELVTLSISGNDFSFGPVVEHCIYNHRARLIGSDTSIAGECQDHLHNATLAVFEDAVWIEFEGMVKRILAERLAPDSSWGKSLLVITGYAKFFPKPEEGDECSKYRFPLNPAADTFFLSNVVTVGTRRTINDLVDEVNRRIQDQIVKLSDRIKFVGIDGGFENQRFCEAGRKTPEGANDPEVWFTSLNTKLLEDNFAPDANSAVDKAWVEWADALAADTAKASDGGGNDGGGNAGGDDDFRPGELKAASSFHPKTAGHAKTAASVKDTLDQWVADGQVIVPVTDFPEPEPIPVGPIPEDESSPPQTEPSPEPRPDPIPKPNQDPCHSHGINICI